MAAKLHAWMHRRRRAYTETLRRNKARQASAKHNISIDRGNKSHGDDWKWKKKKRISPARVSLLEVAGYEGVAVFLALEAAFLSRDLHRFRRPTARPLS